MRCGAAWYGAVWVCVVLGDHFPFLFVEWFWETLQELRYRAFCWLGWVRVTAELIIRALNA